MPYNFHILTVTHKTTHTDDIANFIVPIDEPVLLANRLKELKAEYQLNELMYLATCNRVMFFFSGRLQPQRDFILSFFKFVNPKAARLSEEVILEKVAVHSQEDALRHLYKVAASVDSMVIGEREIFRQLREAYDFCYQEGLTGDNIRLAMRSVVETAKEVYAQTRIGEKPVSIVSLAFQKLLEFKLSRQARFLMVGAGKTNTMFADFMLKQGYNNVHVFNRTLEKANILAEKLEGKSHPLSDLPKHKEGFDALVVCTGSVKPVVTPDLYEKILGNDAEHKVLIDLSLPQNIDKEIARLFDCSYVGIEGLRQLAKQNMAFRLGEVNKANDIIEKRLKSFNMIFRERQIERAMSHLPHEIKSIRTHAMDKVFKNELDKLDEDARDLVERMMEYMEKRCIGIPMVAIKDAYKKIHKGLAEEYQQEKKELKS